MQMFFFPRPTDERDIIVVGVLVFTFKDGERVLSPDSKGLNQLLIVYGKDSN